MDAENRRVVTDRGSLINSILNFNRADPDPGRRWRSWRPSEKFTETHPRKLQPYSGPERASSNAQSMGWRSLGPVPRRPSPAPDWPCFAPSCVDSLDAADRVRDTCPRPIRPIRRDPRAAARRFSSSRLSVLAMIHLPPPRPYTKAY